MSGNISYIGVGILYMYVFDSCLFKYKFVCGLLF